MDSYYIDRTNLISLFSTKDPVSAIFLGEFLLNDLIFIKKICHREIRNTQEKKFPIYLKARTKEIFIVS